MMMLRVTGLVDRRSCSGRRHSTRTADNIELVDKLMLHKNGQARNTICTLYIIIRPYCQQKNDQNWLMNVKDIASQSRHSIQHN